MEITTTVGALKKALTTVKPATTTRSGGLHILSGAKLVADERGLTVQATDLDLSLTTVVDDARVATPGELVVSMKVLAGLMKGKAATPVRIALGEDQVAITAGATSTVRTLPAEEWPRIPDRSGFELTDHALDLGALAAVNSAASRDQTRPILTGVLLTGQTVVATDSYRLHICESPADVHAEFPTMLLPVATAEALVKQGGPAFARFSPDGRSARIETPTATTTTRLIEGDFPNWRQLVPSALPATLQVDRAEFAAAVEQVKAVRNDTSTPVRLRLERTRVTVHAVTQDVGTSEVALPAFWNGADLTVAFNPDFLVALTKGLPSPVLRFSILDALKPAVAVDTDDIGRRYTRLIMPVRLS